MPKIAILGHSHAVALLEAIGDWRKSLTTGDPGDADNRYPASFQSWHATDMGRRLFRLDAREKNPVFDDILVSLLTAGTPGGDKLAEFTNFEPPILGTSSLLRAIMDQIVDRDVVISCLYGNEHVILGMVNSLPLYDFAPFDGIPDAYPLDHLYVQTILNSGISQTILPAILALRSRFPNARIIQVAPPPPLEDPSLSPHREAMEDMIRGSGFVRPSLRLKWYKAYVRAVRSALAPLNTRYLDISDDVTTASGFLRPDYAEGLTHGNELYGQVLAGRLAELLGNSDDASL